MATGRIHTGTGTDSCDWSGRFSTSGFVDVSMAPNGTLWAVKDVASSGRIFRSTDSGQTWQQTNASGFAKVDANNTYLYAVGASSGDVFRAPANSLSPPWTQIVPSGYRDISVAPSGRVWSVGLDGKIRHSNDNGVSWFVPGASGFQSVDANDTYVFACTTPGAILRSTPGNPTSWTNTGANGFRSPSAGPSGRIWAVGATSGDLFTSTGAGTSWTNTGVVGLFSVDGN